MAASVWEELQREVAIFTGNGGRETNKTILNEHRERLEDKARIYWKRPSDFLLDQDTLTAIGRIDPTARTAYDLYVKEKMGATANVNESPGTPSHETKVPATEESTPIGGGKYVPSPVYTPSLVPPPDFDAADTPPPKLEADNRNIMNAFDWAASEHESHPLYLKALALSHPDKFPVWASQNNRSTDDYPWFNGDEDYDDLQGTGTKDSVDFHALFDNYKDDEEISAELKRMYPTQYTDWTTQQSSSSSSSSSSSMKQHGLEWPSDHGKHAKQEDDQVKQEADIEYKDPTANPRTGEVGTSSDPMQPSAQPFQRISAAGGGPFIPKKLDGPEEQRDENDRDGTAALVPIIKGGDSTTDNQPAEATLRPGFQLDPLATKIIPTPEKQIQSDVLFDMFSVVQPGFGKGVDNKLVYENEARENAIQFKQPMYLPRFEHGNADIGIAQHVHPVRWQFQPHGVEAQLTQHMRDTKQQLDKMQWLLTKASALGADPRTLPHVSNHHPSTKGLPRQQMNILRPVIDNRSRWNPVAEAPGFALNQRGLRHLHSPWMEPFHAEHDPMNSGPVLKKRRSLELILP